MSDTTPSFEQHDFSSFVIPDNLDGLEVFETQNEHTVFNSLGQELARVEAMGQSIRQNLSFFNGWTEDGRRQMGYFIRTRFGHNDGHRIIVNEENHDIMGGTLNGQLDIWDFMVDLSRFHIAVSKTIDDRQAHSWKMLEESGPHLSIHGGRRIQLNPGKSYFSPVLGEPKPELSERMRRKTIASELTLFLRRFNATTREDNATF